MEDSHIDDAELRNPIYECPDCGSLTIHGKGSMDGATTLTEAAEKLRDYAREDDYYGAVRRSSRTVTRREAAS